jgi:hypothetical protein
MFWHVSNKTKVPVRIIETHEKDYLVETNNGGRYRVLKSFIHDDISPEDTVAIKCDAAIGMLVTADEMMARRALTVLCGRFSMKDLGWFYKEGFYNVVIIGKPSDFMGREHYFHDLKQRLDAICNTNLKASAQLMLSVFQEVSL